MLSTGSYHCQYEIMDPPVVTVVEGRIKGRILNDILSNPYHSFQGIPYAEPPVGVLRFKAPRSAKPWNHLLDCTKEGSECLSKDFFNQGQIVGSEDCLTLNVYTPKLPDGKSDPLPVMFWIHGGGFNMGSSKTDIYGPDYFMTKDVVLVTINYRLGVFGFLSCEDSSLNVPGNNGFKDMVLALKWVQRNIKNFNGDPNNVTIFGESAGGASTHLLVLSPATKGLFHKTIIQSGCAINPWPSGTRFVKKLAKIIGFETDDEKKALEYLKSLPAEKLLEGQSQLYDGLEADVQREMGYVIEKPCDEPPFLTEHPLDLMMTGRYNKVPIMIGYTSKEGMLTETWQKSSPEGFKMFTDFETKIPHRFKIPKGSDISKKIAERIKEFYFDGKQPTMDDMDKFYDLETDRFFLRGIYMTIKHHLKTSKTPIYFYKFCVDHGLNFYKRHCQIKNPGAAHCDELGYLFRMILVDPPVEGTFEFGMMMKMVEMWTNFARMGDPSLRDVKWRPVEEDKMICMRIDDVMSEVIDPDRERMRFWDEISSMIPHAKNM